MTGVNIYIAILNKVPQLACDEAVGDEKSIDSGSDLCH